MLGIRLYLTYTSQPSNDFGSDFPRPAIYKMLVPLTVVLSTDNR